jgi:hypothetical protein
VCACFSDISYTVLVAALVLHRVSCKSTCTTEYIQCVDAPQWRYFKCDHSCPCSACLVLCAAVAAFTVIVCSSVRWQQRRSQPGRIGSNGSVIQMPTRAQCGNQHNKSMESKSHKCLHKVEKCISKTLCIMISLQFIPQLLNISISYWETWLKCDA